MWHVRLLWFADSPISLLKLLSTDSSSLSKVTEKFKNYYLERKYQPGRPPLDIVSFGEMIGTRVMGILSLKVRYNLPCQILKLSFLDHPSWSFQAWCRR